CLSLGWDCLGVRAPGQHVETQPLCGHWVSYGQATGPLAAIAAERLTAKSATLSRPMLFHYTERRAALTEIAGRVFAALRDGVLRVELRHRYPPAKSATLSRPVLFHYTERRAALTEIAGRVFAALRDGVLRVELRHRYPLAAAAEAHRDLEARRTTGPLLLLPSRGV